MLEKHILKITETKYGQLYANSGTGSGGGNRTEKKGDAVNHPTHYTAGGIETIDGIEAATTGLDGFEGYCTGNAIKYLWRWKRKGGVEDLKKAKWYIDRLVKSKEGV